MVPIPVAWSGPPPPPGPVRQWLFADYLGTPVVMATASLSIVRRRIFEPFGKVLTETDLGGYAPPRLFTGKRYEDDVAMYDFGARWYDPVTASFAAVDPVVSDTWEPLALNAYSYEQSKPLTNVDPDGRHISGIGGFEAIGFGMTIDFGSLSPRLFADLWKLGAFNSIDQRAVLAAAAAARAASRAAEGGGRGAGGEATDGANQGTGSTSSGDDSSSEENSGGLFVGVFAEVAAEGSVLGLKGQVFAGIDTERGPSIAGNKMYAAGPNVGNGNVLSGADIGHSVGVVVATGIQDLVGSSTIWP